jgi:peptidoglycan/LPS O-acetylase OafA/YrhL
MRRLGFLDGLRGWGAMFVLLYHVFCDGMPVGAFAKQYLRLFIPFNAIIAVFVFFLVSGFALSFQYLVNNKTQTLIKIAAGRYTRLAIPVFAACLFVHIALLMRMVAPPAERFLPFQGILTFELTTSYLFRFSLFDVFFNYDGQRTYIGPLWTMSIELYGSFLILGALAVFGWCRWRVVALAVLAGALLLLQSMMALFVLGAVLALCFQRGWIDFLPRWLGFLFLALGCIAPFVLSWSADAWNMLSVTLLTAGCLRFERVRKWLSNPLSSHLGRISFPLYLIHGPIMLVVGAPLMQRYWQGSVAAGLAIGLATVAVSIVASYALVPVNEISIKISRRIGEFAAGFLFKNGNVAVP